MKKFIFLISYIALSISLPAQVKNDVINSQGGSSQYTGGYLASSVAEPFIGTSSGASVTVTQGFLQSWKAIIRQIALKLFIEGLYSGGGMMHEAMEFDPVGESFTLKWGTGIADTVTVELFDDSYSNKVERFQGVNLNTNGNLTITGINPSLSGSYYITVFHRNSVPITTAAPQPFTSNTINYDFTSPIDQAYGAGLSPQKDLGDGIYGMYSGTVDHDPAYAIDGSDRSLLEPYLNLGAVGYLDTDLNGDAMVDGSDLVIMEPNLNFGPSFWNPLFAKKHFQIKPNKK
jgi:hypothetical protein